MRYWLPAIEHLPGVEVSGPAASDSGAAASGVAPASPELAAASSPGEPPSSVLALRAGCGLESSTQETEVAAPAPKNAKRRRERRIVNPYAKRRRVPRRDRCEPEPTDAASVVGVARPITPSPRVNLSRQRRIKVPSTQRFA